MKAFLFFLIKHFDKFLVIMGNAANNYTNFGAVDKSKNKNNLVLEGYQKAAKYMTKGLAKTRSEWTMSSIVI